MLLPTEQPGRIETAAREARESARRERALAAFDTLLMGGDLSLKPNARAEAVGVFGEEFVQGWQESDEETRAALAGMRFNEMVMRGDGEDDIDALMRYREQTGDKSIECDAAMWKHYAAGRKAQLEEAEAARANALALMGRLVRESDEIHRAGDANWKEFEEGLEKGAFSSEDEQRVIRAQRAFSMFRGMVPHYNDAGANVQTQVSTAQLIHDAVGDDEGARALFFEAVQSYTTDMQRTNEEKGWLRRLGNAFIAGGKTLVAGAIGTGLHGYVTDAEVDEYERLMRDLQERPAESRGGLDPNERVMRLGALAERARESGQLVGDAGIRRLSEQEQREIDSLNALRAQMYKAVNGMYEGDEDASWFHKVPGALGRMVMPSAVFLVPGGAVAALRSQFSEQLLDDLGDEEHPRTYNEAEKRAEVSAVIATAVEKIAFGSLNPLKMSRATEWVMKRGFMKRALGGFYGTTGGRVALVTAGGVAEETFAEPAAQLVLEGAYNALAPEQDRLDPAWDSFRQNVAYMCRPENVAATVMYGLLLGGASYPGQKAAAADYREEVKRLVAAGVSEADAALAARIDEPTVRKLAAGELLHERYEALLHEGKKPLEALSQMGCSRAAELVEDVKDLSEAFAGRMPRVVPAGVDSKGETRWSVTTSDEEGKETTVEMSDAVTHALLVNARDELVAEEQGRIADLLLGSLKVEGHEVQEVNERMDGAYFDRLARLAKVKLEAGADADSVDAAAHPFLTLGQAARQGEAWQRRMDVARHETEQREGRKMTDAEWKRRSKNFVSRVNRTRLGASEGRLRTLFRVVRGEAGATFEEVWEDVVEEEVAADMERNGRELAFYVRGLQELERAMGREGEFLRALKDGGVYNMTDVLEAMGRAVRGRVLADTAARGRELPAWPGRFLDMLRRWSRRARALFDLGRAMNEALKPENADKVDAGFRAALDELTERDTERLRGLQDAAAREAQGRVSAAAQMAAAGIDAAPATPILDAAEKEYGDAVREQERKKQQQAREMAQEIAEVEQAAQELGEDGEEFSAQAEEMPRKVFAPTAINPEYYEMFNKALNGGVKRSKVITVMKMPIVLRAALGAGGNIRMQGALFQKMAGKHEFSQEAFAAFPESLFDPIGVFYDRTKENHVVIVDVKVPNQEGVIKNAMVAIEVKADKNGAEVCDIITAFSPNKSDYLKKFISNPVYVDKKRAEVWAGAEEGNILQLLSTALSELGSEVIIRDKLAEVNDKIYQIAHEDDVHFAERLRVAVAALGNDEFMKAPNGMPSKLTPNQWTQVRTQSFRKWFGDWEKVATFRSGVEKLQAMESVANITGKEFEPTGKNDLVQRMVDYWAQHGNVAHNPMLGDVKLDTRSAKDSIAHGVGRIKAAAFAAVHDVIERGVFIEHAADWKGRGKDSYVFAAPISINGEEHICEAIVMKDANRTGFYLHEVQVKEKLLDVFKTGLYTGTSGAPKSILLQVMGRVKDIEKKCSKIVDENGEPLVVYHGTVHGGFRVFDVNGRGKTEGSGAFFTSDKRVAQGYGSVFHAGGAEPQVYACFLNIREPYVVDFEGNSWNRVPGRAAGYFVHYDNGESEWFSNKADADFEVSGYEGKAEIEEDWEESPTLDDLAREVWEESPEVDGLIAENVVDAAVGAGKSYPATDYIVASPNQIKSATENRGTFDAMNEDISFSLTGEDYRIAREFNALEQSEPVAVDVPEVYSDDIKEAIAFARERYRELQRETANEPIKLPDGKLACVTGRGFREVKQHAAGRRELAALCKLRELCQNAIFVNSAENSQREIKTKQRIARFHYYLAKGNFVGAKSFNENKRTLYTDEAYICLAFAEDMDGNVFYDANAANASEIDEIKSASEELQADRVTNTGVAGTEAPYRGRIHRIKEFVNYVNAQIDGFSASVMTDNISMSVSEEAADRVGGMLGDAGVAARSNGAFVRQMEAELRQCMERARAYGSATKGEREAALVAMGSAAQLVTAATAFLPKGYRVNVQHTARQLQVLAELATSGEVDFTRELASQDLKRFAARTKRRLDKRGLDAVEQVLDDKRMEGIELPDDAALDDVLKEFGKQRFMAVFEKLVDDVTTQLRRHARDKVVERMRALLERVRPKRDSKTGSMKNKGGMSADANREMELVEAAMGMNAETLQAELAGLAAKEAAAETEEAAAEIQEKMAIFSTFGNMDGMSYENAQGAYEALLFRVRLNQFAWADKMARQKVERNMAAAAVVEGLGRAGVNEYHDVKVKKPILAQIKDFPLAVASLPHVFYALQGVPALKPLMQQLARRCNNAGENVKIWNREHWMRLEMMSRATLGKSWRRAMNELHEQLNTGVAFDKPIYREFTIRTGYLRELLAMSAAERAEHFAAAKREGGLAAMSVYSERDLKVAAEKLAAMEADGSERAEVKVKYVKEMKHEDDLRMSRGEALYVILMFEQPTYTERMIKQGFTFEVIEGLRDFVGRESFLKFGYGLRELFAEQGERLAKVYEDVYGVPFPREENYFAARWLRHGQQDSTPEALLGGMAGQPGVGTGWMKPRVDHDLEIDTNQDAVAVFLQSTRLSDCWMATQGVVADMRALMRNREFAEAMTAKLGAETYSNLRDWVNVLEGANMQEVVQMKGVEELMRRAYGSGAITMLGFVLRTMIRQTPSFFNGLLGAADISTVEWLTAMARIKRGEAPMSCRRMRESVFMQQRRAGDVAELQRQAMETELKTPWINNLLQAAMAPLEKLDAFWTALSLVPVWNVYYSRAREAGMSQEDAEAEAWEQTKLAANMASQPIGWLNKSKWAQKRNPLVRSMFYMLSEDVNKTALCCALWKGRNRRAAVRAWLVYGAANAFVSVLLDCWTGDPKDWEKAHWWEYVLSAVYGPLASMPCIGELLEELGHCVLYGAGTLADAMGADRETVKELQKARGRATVGRVLFDAGRTYRSVKKIYGFMTDHKKHGLWDYTKAAKGAMAPVAIGAGATGTAVGYWAMAAAVIGNAVDSMARVYRNIEHRMK